MSAVVLSLAEAKRRRGLPPRDRLSAQAEVRCGLVIMLERDREVAMTPAAARTFARSLALLADSAEGASLRLSCLTPRCGPGSLSLVTQSSVSTAGGAESRT